MPDYADVEPAVLESVRSICLALPEAWSEKAWTGQRFMIRKRNFVHVLAVGNDAGDVDTLLMFRSPDEEREVLIAQGHPFFRPGWGHDTMGMVITDDVDWEEVEELVTESYCLRAPKKLVALVDRPEFPS